MGNSFADLDLIRQTIALAQEAMQQGGGPFGALVARKGEVIARAHNRVMPNNDPTAHAEVEAIRAACTQLGDISLAGCTLYCSCMPCPMCLAAAYWANVSSVCYAAGSADAAAAGFDDAYIYRELTRTAAERALPLVQLGREEALCVFHAWQQKEDRVEY